MTRIRCINLLALLGLATLAGCGGTSESEPMSSAVIDTASRPTYDAIIRAAAADHGAPGDNERIQYVLVGENASEGLAAALRECGFANVTVGAP